MKRVYTDERFPGLEIVNEGSESFEVYAQGKLVNRFVTRSGPVSETVAAQRAADFFNRHMLFEAKMRQPTPEEMARADYADPDSTPVPAQELDRLLALERRMTDPAKKAALRRKILSLMAKEESLAAAVVAHLVET